MGTHLTRIGTSRECMFAAALLTLLLTEWLPRVSAQETTPAHTRQEKQTARQTYAAEMKTEGHDCAGIEQQQLLNACMAGVAQNTEHSLNIFYGALRSTLPPPGRMALRQAQRTWLVYRKQTCETVTSQYVGGSLAPFIASSCQVRMTRDRMRLLYDLYSIGTEQ